MVIKWFHDISFWLTVRVLRDVTYTVSLLWGNGNLPHLRSMTYFFSHGYIVRINITHRYLSNKFLCCKLSEGVYKGDYDKKKTVLRSLLRKGVFEGCTQTEVRPFPVNGLHLFVFLNVCCLIETICSRIWAKPLHCPSIQKSPLPVDVRR